MDMRALVMSCGGRINTGSALSSAEVGCVKRAAAIMDIAFFSQRVRGAPVSEMMPLAVSRDKHSCR
jgi:hypothetical protein